VNPAYRPKHLSVSAVQAWAKCPALWHARYVEKRPLPATPPMAFGAAMAKALEALHHGEDHEVAWVLAHSKANAELAGRGMKLYPDVEYGLRLLSLYRQLGVLPGTPEQEFRVYLPNRKAVPVQILGYMDQMCSDRVREFKTSAALWTQERCDNEWQAIVYDYAFRRLNKRKPDCVEYLVMNTIRPEIQVFRTRPTGAELMLFELAAAGAWLGITTGQFDPTCGGKCDACRPANTEPAPRREPAWTL
jgi:hypothetical protein